MRAIAVCLATMLLALGPAPSVAQQGQPPHSWLFGTWTGGVFPVSGTPPAQVCFSQPVVIFTRDLVLRATLTEQELAQRVIESVRTTPTGAEFRFAAAAAPPSILGGGGSPAAGFGCESPDVLHVQRRSENEISFPGCAEFPNPLVRCQTR